MRPTCQSHGVRKQIEFASDTEQERGARAERCIDKKGYTLSDNFPNFSQRCTSERLIQYSEAAMQSAETFSSLLYPFSKSAERTHYNCVFQVHIPYICPLCPQKEGNIRGHPGGKPLVTDHHIR